MEREKKKNNLVSCRDEDPDPDPWIKKSVPHPCKNVPESWNISLFVKLIKVQRWIRIQPKTSNRIQVLSREINFEL